MSAASVIRDEHRFGHEYLDGEDAAMMIAGLENRISIMLEGVEITRGIHDQFGEVTIVTPVAGDNLLLYPFENARSFC